MWVDGHATENSPRLPAALFLFCLVSSSLGLQLKELAVPGVVIKGNPVWLNCTYDIQNDELYSIKWYKNNLEFYRYLPTDSPPAQKYDLPGIFLELERSRKGDVYLSKTDFNTEGTYRCEVSAESPSFQTVRWEKELRVYVLPENGPSIQGARSHYRIGEQVNVTCLSGPSKPAAFLKWYINDLEAPPEIEARRPPRVRPTTGLQISVLGLNFVARPEHFLNGTMKLRCLSVISQAYAKSSEEIVVVDHSKVLPSSSASAAYSTSSGGYGSGEAGSEAVTISGGRKRYHLGDTVDVNCTSARSRPPAELKWFINDKKAKPELVVSYPPVRYTDGQESAVLGLRFQVRPRHYRRGEMRLKCTATLSKVFSMSSREMLLGSSQQNSGLHILDNTGTVFSLGTRTVHLLWSVMVSLVLVCSW